MIFNWFYKERYSEIDINIYREVTENVGQGR